MRATHTCKLCHEAGIVDIIDHFRLFHPQQLDDARDTLAQREGTAARPAPLTHSLGQCQHIIDSLCRGTIWCPACQDFVLIVGWVPNPAS